MYAKIAERVHGLRLQPGRSAGLGEAAPREPGADAVGGQQRVEAAAGVELAAAEVQIGVARPRHVGRRVGDHVHEASQSDLDAVPHELAERPLHGARVVGHLERDRGDHLVGEARQRRAQDVRGLGRDRGEGRAGGRRRHLSRGYSRVAANRACGALRRVLAVDSTQGGV
jgi:hypothetical protein